MELYLILFAQVNKYALVVSPNPPSLLTLLIVSEFGRSVTDVAHW